MLYTVIKTKKQYINYCDKVMELASKKPTKAIEDEIELLEVLIEKWEEEHLSKPAEMDPVQLLSYLMESKSVSRTMLIDILGINKSAISQILNYKKGFSKEVIRKLAETFKVSQEAFNRDYPLHTVIENKPVPVTASKKRKPLHAA